MKKQKNMKTSKSIVKHYGWGSYSKRFTIPRGHKIVCADNLPQNEIDHCGKIIPIGKRYWLLNIPKSQMHNEDLKSWHRNYGILIYESDLI
jgi:hypothetical protein